MCLGVPMKVIEIKDDDMAYVEMGNSKMEISIAFTPDVKVGDYVLVHAGFAIRVLQEDDALFIRKLVSEYENKN